MPAEKIRLALLGCGHMAALHAPSIKGNTHLDLVAACDVNETVVRQWLEKNWSSDAGNVPAFSDPAQMYRQARPDAVLIATPHTAHFEQGMQALKADCHVLMEK